MEEHEDSERLREQIFAQQTELELERARRVRAEVLLDGLAQLISIEDAEASFERLVEVARTLLEFEHAMLLVPDGLDGLYTEFATNPTWSGVVWEVGAFFERVLGGEPAASFQVKLIPEWRHVSSEMGASGDVGSALHVAISGLGSRSMFVCVHSEAAYFSQEDLERLKSLAPLVSQILVHQDHRRARLAEEKARQASQAKSTFLANVSHELRTPLNAIIGYGELLVEETEDQGHGRYHEDLNRLLGAAQHLLTLIGDVLDLSRVEAGHVEVSRDRVHLDALIQELRAMVEPLLEHRSNTLILPTEVGRWAPFFADRGKLLQVLLNLLSNAAKFTQEGVITFGVAIENQRLVCSVSDTGIGIAQENMARLFEEFERVHDGFHHLEGAGLGLALSRKLMREMGGDLEVVSAVGVGSTFTAWLPHESA